LIEDGHGSSQWSVVGSQLLAKIERQIYHETRQPESLGRGG